MIRPITIRTEITLADMCYEVDARVDVTVSQVIHHCEFDPREIAIDCDERIVFWDHLSDGDKRKIIDAIEAELDGVCV